MSEENIFAILERNDLSCCGINYDLYKEFSRAIKEEKDIVQKIIEYNNYKENNNNKYSEDIMGYLRQRHRLNKYDFSKDEELNQLSPNEVFEHITKWNGLLGGYHETIKNWVNEIYGIDLNKVSL